MDQQPRYVGIDVGSVSVNVALMDAAGKVLEARYLRHKGQPMQVAAAALRELLEVTPPERVAQIAATGIGGHMVAEHLNAVFVNEVVAQAKATARLVPEARTIVEIGGEDSKLVFLGSDDSARAGSVADFAMNSMCAAGTGSFLDQQASRLGLTIEEFGELALKSESPPRVAGRCSVFAKSDMIHLQQKATPTHDIVAGLCYALARNFKSTVGSAAKLEPPVSFQGGVAANPGIAKALKDVLSLDDGQFVIPEHFGCMGAIGAVLAALEKPDGPQPDFSGLDELGRQRLAGHQRGRLGKLSVKCSRLPDSAEPASLPEAAQPIPAYLGVDVGSISTNVVVLDEHKRVLAKRYLMTAGAPIEAVRQGLMEVGEEVGDRVEIRGACTTGSGRYLIGDFIGADVVKNEITAQARAAADIDPEVDTIFEIGGQDSKFISLDKGAIVDFEMNKVCAAGTGSFLEEQAEKLGISIKEQFGELALGAEGPINLGERCTVFMESELVRHQQQGAATADLVAGLSYSIVYNYLNRVVGNKRVGQRIFFQGGTAFNKGVVAAFEHVTGKPITVPEHHEVTGAIGCALLAMEADTGEGSSFKGFDLSQRGYEVRSFECRDCANRCEINEVIVEGEEPLYYGSRCEKYDVERRAKQAEGIPDLFGERERLLLTTGQPAEPPPEGAPRVGIPRALLFHELLPLWHAFFANLGCEVVLSNPTSKRIIHEGAEQVPAEFCFPIKIALGHTLNLVRKDIDYIFLPSVINLPKDDPRMTDTFVCPYVQSFSYTVKSAVDFDAHGVRVLEVPVYLQLGPRHLAQALAPVGAELGKSAAQVRRATEAGWEALGQFQEALRQRGQQLLRELPPGQRALVIISRSYNGCDQGANLEIPRKLRDMGVWAIPMDFLPLDTHRLPGDWSNMYWRYGQKILSAAEIVAADDRVNAVYLTNFGCGPDSFLTKFFRDRLGNEACLIIEVDEHSADAGMITRCEAFLDSLDSGDGRVRGEGRRFVPHSIEAGSKRTVLIPNMSGHAYALAAAFEASGMPAEVLPEPDEETLMWGRRHTTGKECFPCIVTTGDMVKTVMNPEFERDKYALFMGGSGGPCRFGQYNALQRMVLDELGFPDVPIYAPNQASSFYNDLGIVGRKFLREGWRGLVAADVIEKALNETRPYEKVPGSAQEAYQQSLDDICETIRTDGDLVAAMRRARERFDEVELDRGELRPIIGLVGEFYIRANRFSNQSLVAQIEELGGEVWMAPVYEWFLYRNFRRTMRAKLDGDYKFVVKNQLRDWVQRRDEHKLVEPFADFLRSAHEPPTPEVLEMAAPYVHHSFEGEAIMTVGKAIDFARKDLSGVVSVMPFTCMPGNISEAILKRVRPNEGGFPYLNMAYDGFEQSTARTRLEAFMHQAREYMERRSAKVT
ncbi:MAG: acyl-CoA dehydratase activase [Armatimonadota bacterium]